MNSIFQNDKREVIATLPIAGKEVRLKPPTGKDMKTIELRTQGETTTLGVVMTAASVLSGLDVQDIEDMDAEDVGVLSDALMLFPIFSKLKE